MVQYTTGMPCEVLVGVSKGSEYCVHCSIKQPNNLKIFYSSSSNVVYFWIH